MTVRIFEIQNVSGINGSSNMRAGNGSKTWKLEKNSVLHVLNVARSYKSDRYGRNSINRSLNVRILCVISIVQNSVKIQNTTWLGKRMLEQCTYDNTKYLQFSKNSVYFPVYPLSAFYCHFEYFDSKSFIYCCRFL